MARSIAACSDMTCMRARKQNKEPGADSNPFGESADWLIDARHVANR